MNTFTEVKNLSPFHFTSLHFSPILPTLHFTLLCYSYLQLTSRNFISLHLLSPSLPLTVFLFPNPRFENMRFTAQSPRRPYRQLVPVCNGPSHKGVFIYKTKVGTRVEFPFRISGVAACLKKRADQLRRTTRDFHTPVGK